MKPRNIESLTSREGRFTRIKSTPPFLGYLTDDVDPTKFKQIIANSHKLDRRWIGWQTTRKCGITSNVNNVELTFDFHTGLEGYLFNHANSQEEAAEYLLNIGLTKIQSMMLMYKNSWKKRHELEMVIRGKSNNVAAIKEWYAVFGNIIAREKAITFNNKQSAIIRAKSEIKLGVLPGIDYQVTDDGQIIQNYLIPSTPTKSIAPTNLSGEKELAWIIVQNIGKLGHPLIRSAMHSK